MSVRVRHIGKADRDRIFAWVEELGWNPGVQDGDCLLAIDPGGMFMAEQDGRPVGCATSMMYDDHFGFVGALMVDPAMRGKGPVILRALHRHVLNYLGDRILGMDAMAATQAFFAAAGCVPAYKHWRFEGPLPLPTGPAASTVVPLADIPFQAICDYDAARFPARRERFWRVWLDAYSEGGRACIREGRLAGFGLIRKARRGWRVGPLLADHPAIAQELLGAMAEVSGREPVALDVPEPHSQAMALARWLGLKEVFSSMRMYYQGCPGPLENGTYSIASYETG